jgi:hypothetical protein
VSTLTARDLLDRGWLDPRQADELRAERDGLAEDLKTLKNERILSVIFAHHKGAPKPFALYRREDSTGVSGTGVVATGAEFDDGVVVLRWRSEWPTSVVFHERGMQSVEAIHGHGGRTEVVWLSDELEPRAELERRAEAAEAKLAAYQPLVNAARAFVSAAREPEHHGFWQSPWPEMTAIIAAVDALTDSSTEEGRPE